MNSVDEQWNLFGSNNRNKENIVKLWQILVRTNCIILRIASTPMFGRSHIAYDVDAHARMAARGIRDAQYQRASAVYPTDPQYRSCYMLGCPPPLILACEIRGL